MQLQLDDAPFLREADPRSVSRALVLFELKAVRSISIGAPNRGLIRAEWDRPGSFQVHVYKNGVLSGTRLLPGLMRPLRAAFKTLLIGGMPNLPLHPLKDLPESHLRGLATGKGCAEDCALCIEEKGYGPGEGTPSPPRAYLWEEPRTRRRL